MKANNQLERFYNNKGNVFSRNTSAKEWAIIDDSIKDQREYQRCLLEGSVQTALRYKKADERGLVLFRWNYDKDGNKQTSYIRKPFLENFTGLSFDKILKLSLKEQFIICDDIYSFVEQNLNMFEKVFTASQMYHSPYSLIKKGIADSFSEFEKALPHIRDATLHEYLTKFIDPKTLCKGLHTEYRQSVKRAALWLISQNKILAPYTTKIKGFYLYGSASKSNLAKPIVRDMTQWVKKRHGDRHNKAQHPSRAIAWVLYTTTLTNVTDIDQNVCDYLWEECEKIIIKHDARKKRSFGLMPPTAHSLRRLFEYAKINSDSSIRPDDYRVHKYKLQPLIDQPGIPNEILKIIDEIRTPLEKRDNFLEHKAQSSLGILYLYLKNIVMPNSKIPFPTSIEDLSERGFIDGDPGCQNYIQYIQKNHSSTAKQYIGELRKAFKYIYEQRIKTSSSVKLDWQFKYKEPTTHLSKTPRIPLPIRIINTMRQTMLPLIGQSDTNNLVMSYDDFKDNFLKEIRNDNRFKNFLYISRVLNNKTERFEKNVFCPLIPSLFYLLLTFPLRPIQARWLDSGELDEFVYSFEKQKMIKNQNGVSGRQMGCIQMISDPHSGTDFPGLYVNTNKTGFYRSDGKQSGYEIPYMPTELLHIFRYCKEWNSIYSTPAGADNYEIDLFVNETTWSKRIKFGHVTMPKVTPLFRNTCNYRHLERSNPVSHNRLYDFYTEVLRNVDGKLKRSNNHFIKLIDEATGKPNSKIDLYTLRVSGITNLFRANVPIEVISEFVAGHATFLMTLHYAKFSAYEVRNILHRAQEAFLSDSLTDDFFKRPELDINNFATSFLHSTEIDIERAYNNYINSNHAGIVDVRIDGLCLSCKNCDQGRPRTAIHNNKVGHENCTQCQFWITGPQFLTGQVMKCNQLMQKMIFHANEIVKLRRIENSRLVEEDAPTMKHSSIAGQLEKFEHCLHKMAEEWEERYQMILASYNLKLKAGTYDQLISTNSTNDIHLNVKKAHDLEYLNLMSAAAEIYPEFKTERYDIKLEHIISRILAASSNDLDASLFLCLDDATRKEASFAFSEMILNMLHSDDQNQQVENIERAIGEGLPMEMIPEISQQLSVFSQSSKAKKELGSNGPLALESE